MAYQYQPQGAVAVPSTQSLLAQVLGITALGLCITALAVYLFPNVGYGFGLGAMLLGLIMLFAMSAMQGNPTVALVMFYAFAFVEGIGLSPTINHYVQTVGPPVVFNAAATTGLGMFALAAIVYATGINFLKFQGILFFALLALVVAGVANIFLHFLQPTVYSWLTLAIFSGLVLVDFARIRAIGNAPVAPVMLAVSIYLDAVNIFLALLQIFGSRGSRRD
jgi:modulator of FtsH protease